MPRGDEGKYTSRQKRKAHHIEEGYEKRGVSDKEAARRAYATVNKEEGGGRKKGGSGRGKKKSHASSRKGGRKGGRAHVGHKRKSTGRKRRNSTSRRKPNSRKRSS